MTIAELMEALGLSQPTLFAHMKKLTQAGVLEVCSRKNPARYRLCSAGLDINFLQLL